MKDDPLKLLESLTWKVARHGKNGQWRRVRNEVPKTEDLQTLPPIQLHLPA